MKKLNVKLPQGGSKRALHSGMYASALAVVVLAVIILVNLVIRALPTKYTEYDISTTSLFTLSDTTENLLHELNADVTAYYLAESGQEDANITRLLDRYAGESSHFSWQQRDPVLYPTFAQQYDGASAGSVVLVCGDNSDVLSYNDMYEMDLESYYTTGTANYSFQAENALTSGIAKVTPYGGLPAVRADRPRRDRAVRRLYRHAVQRRCDRDRAEPDHRRQHPGGRECRAYQRAGRRPDRCRDDDFEGLRGERRQAVCDHRLHHRDAES